MYQYKRPPKPTKPKVPKGLYLVFAVILLISAAVIVNYIYQDFRYTHGIGNVLAQEPIEEPYIPAPTSTPTPTPAPTPEPIVIDIPEQTPEPTPTPIPRVFRDEFSYYRAHYGNDNIIGRVWIPNTTVDYLVVQGTDNDFYLHHDLRHRRTVAGSIFIDYLADIHTPGGDQNWVLFGHNMRANHKFHMVRNFLNADFFWNNRFIYFSTIYADYVFEIFSTYVTHIEFNYIEPCYGDEWDIWINKFRERSRFDTGIEVSSDDRILTLSTCEGSYRHNRIVVHGVLVSETFPHLDGDQNDDYNYDDAEAAG